MRWVTLFLETENEHLLKDVGMIPWYMMKEHGADCSVVTWKNSEEYTYADDEVAGLKLEFVPRSRFGREIDGILYLLRNARKTDVLNIYHLNLSSYLYEIVYRLFNRKGCIYLKLDMNTAGLVACFKKNPVGMIKRAIIRRADIASVETIAMKKKLHRFFGDKIIYIPNGCCMRDDADVSAAERKNIILTVGNLGTYEKATDVLLEAFAMYTLKAKNSDWRLRLVGNVEESFWEDVVKFHKKYPGLEKRVTFTGPVTDKEKLDKEYRQAKIFALPSRSESLDIVPVEAASRGCYLITSDMVPAGYDISHGYENGMSVKAGDAEALSEAFLKICDGDMDWEKTAQKTAAYLRTAYDWSRIVDRLYDEILLAL